jgi:hypothetical protein
VNDLFQSDPLCLSEVEQQTLADELINRCLFTFEIQPLESDIGKATDIQAAEKNQLNKAQSTLSRKVAFDLLQTLCDHSPTLITQIINVFFFPLLK